MSVYDSYQNRVRREGLSYRERQFKNKQRSFDLYFERTLNKEEITLNGVKKFDVVLQDHSPTDNNGLSDDKYVIAKNEDHFSVGDYMMWRDQHWIVFTKENRTVTDHQQGKVKEANEIVRWIRNGEIVNEGRGWYAYVQSQTLYTMGVAVTPYIQTVDSKMLMYLRDNEESRDLRMDERVFIGPRVYKIKFTDAVSRQGLISFLLDEDTIGPYDNIELGVADYYRFYGKDDDITKHPEELDNGDNEIKAEIIGDTALKISREYTFELSEGEAVAWKLIHADFEAPYHEISKSGQSVTIKIKNDNRFVGSILTITAELEDGSYVSLPTSIVVRY